MKKLAKARLHHFLDYLKQDYEVLVPTEEGFQETAAGLRFIQPVLSPKNTILPQTEELFRYDGSTIAIQPAESKTVLVFGLRPCDAASPTISDYNFASDDPYYTQRRKKVYTIALACTQPARTCFCTALGLGPFSKQGSDAMMIEFLDYYVFYPITDRLTHIFQNDIFETVTEGEEKEIASLEQPAIDRIRAHRPLNGLSKRLAQLQDSDFWDTVSASCLGCGACTFLCPTCWCFDIADLPRGNRGRRIRTWDSCMHRLYSQEASGNNPRPTTRERMRQRILHKFLYIPKLFNTWGCVGCGRCIKFCPADIDIREILDRAQTESE